MAPVLINLNSYKFEKLLAIIIKESLKITLQNIYIATVYIKIIISRYDSQTNISLAEPFI